MAARLFNVLSSGAPRGPAGRRCRGFTLVELLVVIGIIALLISILLPSLNAARKQASRISCAANIRSIGQAYQIYAGEYKQQYPPVEIGNWATGHWQGNNTALGPALMFTLGHLNDGRILHCPSAIDGPANYDRRPSWMIPMWARGKQRDPGNWAYPNSDNSIPGVENKELQTGYPLWFGRSAQFNINDPRYNLWGRDAADRGDKVVAADWMMRQGGEETIGHRLQKRKRLGTVADVGHEPDPNPDNKVIFEGGNVLYNDGHVVWKDMSEIKYRYEHYGWHWFH